MSINKIHLTAAGLRGRAGTVLTLAVVGASLLAAGPATADSVGQGSGSGAARKGCKVTGVNPAGDKHGSTYSVPDGTKVTVNNPGGKSTEWTCSDGTWAASIVAGGSGQVVSAQSSLHLQGQVSRRLAGRKLTIIVRAASPARTSARLS